MNIPTLEQVENELQTPTSNCVVFVSECERIDMALIAGTGEGFEFSVSVAGRQGRGMAENEKVEALPSARSALIEAVHHETEHAELARHFIATLIYATIKQFHANCYGGADQ